MDSKFIEQKTYDLLEKYLESLDYELVFVEFVREQSGWVLRLYIDSSNGVTVGDCAKISELIEPVIDVENYIKPSYFLEVSSPGLNRPLRKVEHFKKVIGDTIKVVLTAPIENNRKNYKGTLIDVRNDVIVIKSGSREIELPFNKIKKSNLIYKF